ncbi:hypothetical protein PENTCL1PPCAC_13559, partial [Pristionchus entomophagus]
RTCNHSYSPWSELFPDGRVRLTDHCPREAECLARAVLLRSEYQTKLGKWHEIGEKFIFENDIVEVECKINEVRAYHFLHSQIWRQESMNHDCRAKRTIPKVARKPPSVHIIMLDSIGAAHGRRLFNRIHRYLKREFGAVEMLHMNKIGENSRPNAMGFLLGKLTSDIQRDMYGMPSIPAEWNYTQYCHTFLDDKGFILSLFEKNGYATMMAEDWDEGVFNFPRCKGFEKQPTTHYMRPFQIRVKHGGKTLDSHMGQANCFEQHLFLNDYHEKFMNAYTDTPIAALTWASHLGHDSPTKPFHADIQYEKFFERNKKELDDSFVFFMGDHGLRFGWLAQDPAGQRDINNPMLMISVPRFLRDDNALMANLQHNSGQLLTHFDTHATFVDIVETFSRKDPTNFSQTTLKPDLKGSSLLRPFPDEPRSCKTLPIPPQYCICETTKEQLNVTDQHLAIGRAVAAFLNNLLAKHKYADVCAELQLDELMTLIRIEGAAEVYEVTVRLRPGGGIFR